jgi:iron complex outermembrane receptor protein
MQKHRSLLRALGIPLVALASAAPAFAEDAASQVEEIVVTGSYISGTPKDAALPVDVITMEDLKVRGDPSAMDMIRALPYVGPIMGESNQFGPNQGTIGTGSVNLRGLGGQRTLILMNGRRTTYTPAEGPTGVDTNLLPIDAVGRVEVLKDGAAAIYGSDAIAGVVNFITRRDLDGLEIGGNYRDIDGSSDNNMHINWGWQGDDGSNFLLSLAQQNRGELKSTDRDWANPPYLTNPSGWSGFGMPGTFVPRSAALAAVAPLQVDSNCNALGGFQSPGVCRFSFIPFDNIVEETQRQQVYAELNSTLGDSTEFHVEALYADTSMPNYRTSPGYPPTSGPNGPGAGQFFVPDTGPTPFANNPGALIALQQAGLAQGVIDATKVISLAGWRPNGWGGVPSVTGGNGGQSNSSEYDMGRVSASLTGELEGLGFLDGTGWDTAMTYSTSTYDRGGVDVQILRLKDALAGLGGPNCNGIAFGSPGSTCQAYNPFSNGIDRNPAQGFVNPGFTGNQNTPEMLNWLTDRFNTQFRQSLFVFDGVLNGESGLALPGGNVGWALGSQYRLTNYDGDVDSPLQNILTTPCADPANNSCGPNQRTGPNIFLGQFLPQTLNETVYAAFGELAIPILDTLEAQLAVRYEDYGGDTGDTTDPKLSMRWQATDWLALRGSAGTTFRGPTPLNRVSRIGTGLQPLGVAANQYRSIDFVGNPALAPETADTYSLGFILQLGGFRAIVDYWNYKFEDQITTVPFSFIANAVGTLPGVPANGTGTQLANCASGLRYLVTFGNGNTCTQGVTVGNDISRIQSNTVNGSEVTTAGYDIELTYDFGEIIGGDLTTGISATYVDEYEQEAFAFGGVPISPQYEAVGFANYERNPGTISEIRAIGHINYRRGPLNVRYEARYVDGVEDDRGPGAATNAAGVSVPVTFGLDVDSFTAHNLVFGMDLPWETYVSLAIMNLTDEDPPDSRLQLSYDPYIGDPLGRTIQIGFTKTFSGS